MGDMSDFWRDVKPELQAHSRAKREKNRERSAQYLTTVGITYNSKNLGAHLIVESNDGLIDFWPGTGRWVDRQTLHKGFGVFKLIKHISKGSSK